MTLIIKGREPRFQCQQFFAAITVVTAMLLAASVDARIASAAPTIGNIAPPSLQIGSTVSLRIDGGDLAANPRLLLPVKIVEQTVKPGGAANQIQLDVKLDAEVQPGIYLARIATDTGVSNAFPLSIDSLPTTPVPTTLTQIPSSVFGDLTGGNVIRTTFNGAKDQAINIEVEARRLGGKLNPVVRLLDSRGVQIAWGQGERRLGGDARLSAKLPAAGVYTVELHDLLFRGEGPGRFRLKIGDWKYAHFALPLGVQRGTAANVALLGGNIDRAALVDARLLLPGMRPARWPAGVAASGNGPTLVVSDYPELVEHETVDAAGQMLAAAPISVSGRLSAKGEEDRYVVPVTPGQPLRLELFAERIGSPIDGVVIVRNSNGGGELARGDDQAGTTDPTVNFAVPAGVNAIVVAVSNLAGKGGDDYVYRLAITPPVQAAFSPTVPQDATTIAVGGRSLVRVAANRAGHDGPIRLSYNNLPAGIGIAGSEIPQGINQSLLVLSAAQASAARVALHGEASIAGSTILRTAKAPDFPAAETQPWLREELTIAAAGSAPLVVDWSAADPLSLLRGGSARVAVKLTRSAGVTGPIRLTLLTSQTIPKKMVENREIDDETKALRAEAVVANPPESGEAALSIVVPADLPPLAYDLVVQADLLSADSQQVVATTYTLPRRVSIRTGPEQ